jgi:hypothetical protein
VSEPRHPKPSGILQRVYVRARRALDPGAERDRERLGELSQLLPRAVERSESQARKQAEALGRLTAAVTEQHARIAHLERDLGWVKGATLRQRRVNSQLLRRAALDERTAQHAQRVRERLKRYANSTLPIIVGPWTGEVGFELLYWIPFLQWATESYPIDRERLIVVSRGGVASWYGHVASGQEDAGYADAFTYVTPESFRDATEAVKKQRGGSRGFERQLVREVMRSRGLRRAHLLHPSLMYDLYWSFWAYASTVKQLDEQASFRRLPAVPKVDGLPDDYVAVRFYFSRCFPETPENRAFVQRTLAALSARTDVVLLNTPFSVDDHRDFTLHAPRIHSIADRMEPATNLALQTAVIANARAFVGTYGGYAYLAPLCGVESVAFYSRSNFKRQHLDLAHRVFNRLGTARLTPVDVATAGVLDLACASV